MAISFVMEDDGKGETTPLNFANMIIDSGMYDCDELKELIAYLSIFTNYNPDFGMKNGPRLNTGGY